MLEEELEPHYLSVRVGISVERREIVKGKVIAEYGESGELIGGEIMPAFTSDDAEVFSRIVEARSVGTCPD